MPAGKIRLSVPGGRAKSATVNGAAVEIDDEGRVVIQGLPAEVEISVVPESRAIASPEISGERTGLQPAAYRRQRPLRRGPCEIGL